MRFAVEVMIFGAAWLLGIYLTDRVFPPLAVEWLMVWGMAWYLAASKVASLARMMFPPSPGSGSLRQSAVSQDKE